MSSRPLAAAFSRGIANIKEKLANNRNAALDIGGPGGAADPAGPLVEPDPGAPPIYAAFQSTYAPMLQACPPPNAIPVLVRNDHNEIVPQRDSNNQIVTTPFALAVSADLSELRTNARLILDSTWRRLRAVAGAGGIADGDKASNLAGVCYIAAQQITYILKASPKVARRYDIKSVMVRGTDKETGANHFFTVLGDISLDNDRKLASAIVIDATWAQFSPVAKTVGEVDPLCLIATVHDFDNSPLHIRNNMAFQQCISKQYDRMVARYKAGIEKVNDPSYKCFNHLND